MNGPSVTVQRLRAGAAALRAHPTQAAVTVEALLTRFGLALVSLALPLYALSMGMAAHELGLMYALRTVTTVATPARSDVPTPCGRIVTNGMLGSWPCSRSCPGRSGVTACGAS